MAVNAPEACQRFEINARSVWTIRDTPMMHAQADALMEMVLWSSGPAIIAAKIATAANTSSKINVALFTRSTVFLFMSFTLSSGCRKEAIGKRAKRLKRQGFRTRIGRYSGIFKRFCDRLFRQAHRV